MAGTSLNNNLKVKEESRFYKLRLFFIRIRHGLFLMTFRNILAKIGIDVGPYYLVQEGFGMMDKPKIKTAEDNYIFGFLTLEEIKSLKNIPYYNPKELVKRNDDGLKVVGLKAANRQIAAAMCIEYKSFTFKKKDFHLKDDETYLLNMYTYQNFRGQNLAPYLRYCTYEALKEEGIKKIYSITDYFNKSSWKFKKKLGAKPLTLYFTIMLFKKYHKTFKIKDYEY
ncbi:MAG: GNAT family N-acetyltransferase [Allomuricauda sp.]